MKKVLAAIILLVVVLVGAVFALPLVLSSDSLRTALARQLSAASGAEISLDGPVRFSVFPDFGIVADGLAYMSGDGSVSVAAARTVASVRLVTLLSDRIRITGVELDRPRILLSSPKDGAKRSAPARDGEGDVFKLAASWLEKFSIDRVRIRDGEVSQDAGAGPRPVASGLDLELSVPGIDEPASIAFSGTVNGRAMKLDGEIGSLRDLLGRQPAEFSLSAEMTPPPHPALASVGVSGRIQLANDGSYRIEGGEVTSAGQPMRIDASYVPGERPFIQARIKAGVLDYADFEPAQENAAAGKKTGAGGGGKGSTPDFSALRDIDVDVALQADAVRAGKAVAKGLSLQTVLRDGKLKSTINSEQIAGGRLETAVFTDFNEPVPEIKGYVNLAAIDIESLARLAGRKVPAAGRLTSRLQYAFRGTDMAAIRNTINVKGDISVRDGTVETPQLVDVAGKGAGRIAALNAKTEITDISAPLAVSGTMNWNGENVGFASSVALVDLLSGKTGAVTVDLKSRPVNGRFTGTVGLDGKAKGKAVIQAASLSRLLAWVGQDAGTPLGRFAFSGAIAAGGDTVALSDARITLDDMAATGTASLAMRAKTAIKANLAVNAIDFAKLTGGGGEGSGKSSARSSGATPIDLAVLRTFDADIRMKANRIGYGDVKAGPATATLTVKDGVARLSVPKAGFYDGAVAADVTADGAGKLPAIDLQARLDGVSALPFLTDAAGFKRIEGKLDAELAVKGSGTSTDTLARSLGGNARVVFSDGALRGIDVAKLVNNLQSLIKGGYKENAKDRTEFTELSVSYDIRDGVARTQDLKLLGPLVRMDGSGSIDLAEQAIDMRLNPRVVSSLDGQGGDFDVAGLGMPILVTGPLAKPRIYPDITGILANPEQALQALSRLGVNVGKLADGAGGAADVLKQALGDQGGAAANDAVKGVIEGLTGNKKDKTAGTGGENGKTGNTQDLVGSLLQGVLGQNRKQDQPAATGEQQAAVPPRQEPANTDDSQPASGAPADAAGADEEPTIVLPTRGPILVPNPRKAASAGQPPKKPEKPKSLTDQAVEKIVPQVVPEDKQDQTSDFIKGLLNQMDQQ